MKKVVWAFAAVLLFALFTQVASDVFPESPWAYALTYDTDDSHMHIVSRPVDCDFLHAPIGFKGCHYKRSVQVLRYSIDAQSGQRMVSIDGRGTWPAPSASEGLGPIEIYVSWDRVEKE
jgi:hypothetical protein